ncbi:MAG: Rieske (2Fe-2S) protein [Gammaproteobacteria bacterium]
MNNPTLIELDLGPLAELPDPGARQFSPPGSRFEDDYFVVRRGAQLACFSNVCMHMQQPLNWAPNRFLNKSGEFVVCPAHGATYDALSGECRGGPCNGRALTSWPVTVNNGRIIVRIPDARADTPT